MLDFLHKIINRKDTVIYTAIFGDYDELKNPLKSIKDCDFICFTDNPQLKSKVFNIKLCGRRFDDPCRDARLYKILPHKFLNRYKYSIWIDGSVLIKMNNPRKMIKKYLKRNDIALFAHPERNCIYDELTACIQLKKDKADIMQKQINYYKQNGYPANNGLVASAIILRKHLSPEIIKLDEDWWKEISQFSRRDQLCCLEK